MKTITDYLSVRDVAKRINVSYITALGYVKSGKIKGIERGCRWFISESELDRWETNGNNKVEEVQDVTSM